MDDPYRERCIPPLPPGEGWPRKTLAPTLPAGHLGVVMSLLRPSLLGAKILGRSLSIWPFLLLACWAALIKFQEPAFFAHQGVPFFWPSQLAMTMLVVGLLPLAWRLTQGFEAAVWTLQSARSVRLAVLSTWLGVVGYGAVLILCALAFSITASWLVSVTPYRIPIPWADLAAVVLSSAEFLLVIASFAPALALTPWSTPTIVVVWLPVLAVGIHFFGPPEFSDPSSAATMLSGILSALLATLGGLAVSLAHTYHRLRL